MVGLINYLIASIEKMKDSRQPSLNTTYTLKDAVLGQVIVVLFVTNNTEKKINESGSELVCVFPFVQRLLTQGFGQGKVLGTVFCAFQ
jgi:hypothetical protein